MTTPVQDRGPVHAKMAERQTQECIALLSELMQTASEIAARRESVTDWIASLDADRLMDFNSALSILGMLVPYMRMAMLMHPKEALEAAAARMKARERAQREAIVQSGGHDAL